MNRKWQNLLISIFISFFITLVTTLLFPLDFEKYLLGFFTLSLLFIYGLIWLYQWAGGQRFLAIVIFSAFFLRFGLGMFFTLALPHYGYAEEVQQSGYLFADAYQRDTQAWKLADSDASILTAFNRESFFSDQYGGLLALSAIVYRVFSPEIHFKINILLLIAFMSTVAIPFVWKALQDKNNGVQKLSVLLIAFYPDVILYSASEMREGLIIGLSAILFFLATRQAILNLKMISVGVVVSAGLLLVNLKIGFFIIFSIGVWYLLFNNNEFSFIKKNRWAVILISLGVITVGLISVQWLAKSSQWDSAVLVMESGWIENIIHQIGKKYRLPFATVYGFLRPLLPAAIIETSIPIWKTIAIIRSVAWYLIMPILLYGFVYGLRSVKQDKGKNLALWLLIMVWLLLSALRAGGDQWDNPRYRINLIVLISIYLSETIYYIKQHKDHWFVRIVISILVFLGFFFYWYINRYIGLFIQIDFYKMILLILISFGIIFSSGLVYEYRTQKK